MERWLEFVQLPAYLRAVKGLLTDADQRDLETILCENPFAGAVVSQTGGVRKLRFALAGRGKSGGMRVVYFFRNTIGRVCFLYAYPKNVQGDLTSEQKRQIRQLTSQLEDEP